MIQKRQRGKNDKLFVLKKEVKNDKMLRKRHTKLTYKIAQEATTYFRTRFKLQQLRKATSF